MAYPWRKNRKYKGVRTGENPRRDEFYGKLNMLSDKGCALAGNPIKFFEPFPRTVFLILILLQFVSFGTSLNCTFSSCMQRTRKLGNHIPYDLEIECTFCARKELFGSKRQMKNRLVTMLYLRRILRDQMPHGLAPGLYSRRLRLFDVLAFLTGSHQSSRPNGKLPRYIVNPKEHCKAVSLRSSKELEDPKVREVEVEKQREVEKHKEHESQTNKRVYIGYLEISSLSKLLNKLKGVNGHYRSLYKLQVKTLKVQTSREYSLTLLIGYLKDHIEMSHTILET
ncbi:hypothetical protein M9H77_02904 [Catharanthus roseus]|uniref:Uncharacterized protein n=1 Tax=Catharanthus roseus TaxID=4058 RepID=A0ACC0C9S4_CATRO|nr:hypothetical protein M9H77_02904 [Catharanthus roseus]